MNPNTGFLGPKLVLFFVNLVFWNNFKITEKLWKQYKKFPYTFYQIIFNTMSLFLFSFSPHSLFLSLWSYNFFTKPSKRDCLHILWPFSYNTPVCFHIKLHSEFPVMVTNAGNLTLIQFLKNKSTAYLKFYWMSQ